MFGSWKVREPSGLMAHVRRLQYNWLFSGRVGGHAGAEVSLLLNFLFVVRGCEVFGFHDLADLDVRLTLIPGDGTQAIGE